MRIKKNSGFTLIEVLVSVIVLALGLLGMAKLQTTGLNNNQSAYNRSQAMLLANDIGDRMRANNCLDGTSASKKSVADNYITATSTATCPGSVISGVCSSCEGTANICTPTQLASKDLYDWKSALSKQLPKGKGDDNPVTGTIAKNGLVYTITIHWDDNKDGDVDSDDPNFDLNIQLLEPSTTCS